MNAISLPIDRLTLAQLQQAFLDIRQRVIIHAKIHFGSIACRERRADCIAEAVALAWRWFLRLAKRGKDARRFPSVLATYAVKAVKCGRRLTGQLKPNDVLSERAQRKHGFRLEHLPASLRHCHEDVYSAVRGQNKIDAFEERLTDNRRTPPPDQAAFRLDFPVWRRRHTHRDRRLIDDMMRDERTKSLAKKYGLSEGRISQMRRAFHDDWHVFVGDREPVAA
jgi:hypothetical protein